MCEYNFLTQELVKIDPWSSRLQLAFCLIASQLSPSITLSDTDLQGAANKPRQDFCVANIAIELKKTLYGSV